MSFICQEIIVSWRDQCSRAPIFCLFLTLFALSGPLSPYHNSGEEGRLCRTSPALSVRTRKTKMSWETNTRRPAAFHAPGASTGPAAQIRRSGVRSVEAGRTRLCGPEQQNFLAPTPHGLSAPPDRGVLARETPAQISHGWRQLRFPV